MHFSIRPVVREAGRMPEKPNRAAGVATLLGSALSNQVGAAVGSFAFPVLISVGLEIADGSRQN